MHSTKYTLIYTCVLTIVVAIVLSLAATGLKPFQEKNIELERKKNILKAINDKIKFKKTKQIETYYAEHVQELVINNKGDMASDVIAAELNIKKEYKKPLSERQLPLYVYKSDDGKQYYVIEVRGVGLWGPISGCVAFKDDLNTIQGTVFDHEAETPGLGAEITKSWFQDQFRNKKIHDNSGAFVSVNILKGKGNELDVNTVDGISGATLTCIGMNNMLKEGFEFYLSYFNKIQ